MRNGMVLLWACLALGCMQLGFTFHDPNAPVQFTYEPPSDSIPSPSNHMLVAVDALSLADPLHVEKWRDDPRQPLTNLALGFHDAALAILKAKGFDVDSSVLNPKGLTFSQKTKISAIVHLELNNNVSSDQVHSKLVIERPGAVMSVYEPATGELLSKRFVPFDSQPTSASVDKAARGNWLIEAQKLADIQFMRFEFGDGTRALEQQINADELLALLPDIRKLKDRYTRSGN